MTQDDPDSMYTCETEGGNLPETTKKKRTGTPWIVGHMRDLSLDPQHLRPVDVSFLIPSHCRRRDTSR